MVKVGIIGGSGIYNPSMFRNVKEKKLRTPFGSPSDSFITGEVDGVETVFLSRHGRGHRYSPSDINYRANIYGLKKLGVTHIISVSAVGSLKEDYKPLDIVIPDQVYDRTTEGLDVLRGRYCGSYRLCRSLLPAAVEHALYRRVARLTLTHNGGSLPVHGGAPVLHEGRVQRLQEARIRYYRHDRPTRGQAGTGGRDVLRHHSDDHRLRRLARGAGDDSPGHRERRGTSGPCRTSCCVLSTAFRRSRPAAAVRRCVAPSPRARKPYL